MVGLGHDDRGYFQGAKIRNNVLMCCCANWGKGKGTRGKEIKR